MKQPYRDLKVKAKQVDDAVLKLLQERQVKYFMCAPFYAHTQLSMYIFKGLGIP